MECLEQKKITGEMITQILLINDEYNKVKREIESMSDSVFSGLTESEVRDMCLSYVEDLKESVIEALKRR
tara:strand:+ start:143 stop:352 length:210 start_codon:yes stop_codon:yes gene_type:complete